jgi:hypothetical protein
MFHFYVPSGEWASSQLLSSFPHHANKEEEDICGTYHSLRLPTIALMLIILKNNRYEILICSDYSAQICMHKALKYSLVFCSNSEENLVSMVTVIKVRKVMVHKNVFRQLRFHHILTM